MSLIGLKQRLRSKKQKMFVFFVIAFKICFYLFIFLLHIRYCSKFIFGFVCILVLFLLFVFLFVGSPRPSGIPEANWDPRGPLGSMRPTQGSLVPP